MLHIITPSLLILAVAISAVSVLVTVVKLIVKVKVAK